MKNKTITILGMGSWGMTLGLMLHNNGYKVQMWEYLEERVKLFNKTHRFDLFPWITIPKDIKLFSDVQLACQNSEIIIFAVPSKAVRVVASNLKKYNIRTKIIVSVVKGLENKTFKRMSEVIAEGMGIQEKNIYVLSGPSHAEEVAKEIPTSVVVAGDNNKQLEILQKMFANTYFRVYTSHDKTGVEIGGAIKNIIAIASGICDGLGLGDNTKAALMTRSLAEIIRFGKKFKKSNEATFYGLSGLGDLIVTCMSKHSRNRHVGELIGKGEKLSDILNNMNMVAEGVFAVKAVYDMSKKYNIDMPITSEVYKVLYKNKRPDSAVKDLMTRRLKKEREV